VVAGPKKLIAMITTFVLRIGVNPLLVASTKPPKILVKISAMLLPVILKQDILTLIWFVMMEMLVLKTTVMNHMVV
jgi:hypothetical protein